MNTRSRIVGAHVWFAREGENFTIPTNGVVSRTAKPGANDASWDYLGIVGEATMEHRREQAEVWGPTPGRLALMDVLDFKHQLTLTATLRELGPKQSEYFYNTGRLNSTSTNFNIFSSPQINGWVKFQAYDEQNNLLETLDFWAHATVTGQRTFDGQRLAELQVQFQLLESPLNAGLLG